MRGDCIVFGGGMTGIVAAFLLAQEGRKVTIVEPRGGLGGVNTGRVWEGFCLDFGCHLFGNESDVSTSVLLDLMDGEVVPVDVVFASILGGKRTEGFELPALDSLGEEVSARILKEVIAAASSAAGPPPKNLKELLIDRYGPTAASILDSCLQKVFPVPASELAPEAIHATTFRRIKIVSNEMADLLKQLPALDERIARGSSDDPMRFYRNQVRLYPHRSFYPKSRGMLGFAERATRKLEALGVHIVTGSEPTGLGLGHEHVTLELGAEKLTAEELIWTAGLGRLEPLFGGTSGIIHASQSVPMVLYYFDIDKRQETGTSYVNSFDREDLVFRTSVPGLYGPETCPPERSYVCCEVPTSLDSDVWNDPSRFTPRIWDEVLRFGVATGEPGRTFIQKAKTSYKAPRADFGERSAWLSHRLSREPRVWAPPEWAFSTTRTILELIPRIRGERAA